ncbi:hypothetical protein QZH41_006326 [Actinostola sp. cb2023]|nr:hypothetical protein QZH41_006326 [Actinostola sp. cb2023]
MMSAENADGSAKLDDDQMISQSVTFLLAGHETSNNTLAMSAYHLALNPDVQERLRCETLIAQQTNPDKPLYELGQELEYLECVNNEVLRLGGPGHMINRSCSKPYKINDVTTIPAGMEVIIPIYSLHHDPEAWPEVEKFDPERFRGDAKESRHPFQFIPFGEGPRNCIGKRFALLEVKITLVNILTNYKIVRCPRETQVPLKMIAGDIRKAFLQVRIRSADRDALRFHWIDKEDPSKIRQLRFIRALFGLGPSPFLLGGVIQQHLKATREEHPDIVRDIEQGLYVDDLLLGGQTVQDARAAKDTATEIFGKAGFELHKWNSNARELELDQQDSDTADSYAKQQLQLKSGECGLLGLKWDKDGDTI